jgi:diguanylate cyclase (GGDEF)-like protein/PAS domain S-box-containing protein
MVLAKLDLKRDDSEYLRSLNVLYVEDDDGIRAQLERFLSRRVGGLVTAGNGQEGLALFRQHRPDIVITDILMPVMNGLAMVEAIRRSNPRLPVIITTAFDEADYLLKAIELGVEAYVLKPVKGARLEQALLNCARNLGFEAALKQSVELVRLVLSSLDEAVFVIDALTRQLCDCNTTAETLFGYRREEMVGRIADFLHFDWASLKPAGEEAEPGSRFRMEQKRMRRKSGEAFFSERYVYPIRDSAGRTAYAVIVVRDVSQHKRAEESVLDKRSQLDFLGYHDPLTGLTNRLLFHDRLRHALVQARRRKDSLAVLFLNLDGFKSANDLWGHDLGDELLQAVAARLALSVREQDTVARFGGDEFVLLLEEVEGEAAGAQVAATVISALGQSFDLQGHCLSISASAGLSLSGADSVDAETLVKQAAQAMGRAKKQGGGCFCFYGDDPGRLSV